MERRCYADGRFVALLGVVLGQLGMQSDVLAQRSVKRAVVVTGTITDKDGRPVPYAHAADSISRAVAVSNPAGRFRLSVGSATSSVALTIRRIGYSPFDTTFLNLGSETHLQIVLSPMRADLDTVRIRASRGYDEYLDRRGFYRRLTHKVDGTFITSDQVERRSATELSAVLRDVSGVRVVASQGKAGKRNFVLGRGGLCALGVVLDGQRVEVSSPPLESIQPRITSMMGGRPVAAVHKRAGSGPDNPSLDEIIPPSMIAAIEVYPSAASVPNELQHHTDGCGLIVAWTRYGSR